MPQAEVADLMQALGQHVLQKAAHELVAGKACVEQAARGALPVTDGDAGRIEANDAAVGDGYAVDIARQILEHGVGAVAPGRAVHDPRLAPHRLGDKEVGALLGERGPELAAHEVCERSSRRQIVGPRRTPAGPVRRHAADVALDAITPRWSWAGGNQGVVCAQRRRDPRMTHVSRAHARAYCAEIPGLGTPRFPREWRGIPLRTNEICDEASSTDTFLRRPSSSRLATGYPFSPYTDFPLCGQYVVE